MKKVFCFYSLYDLLCLNLSFGKLLVGTSVFENDASGLVAKFCEKKNPTRKYKAPTLQYRNFSTVLVDNPTGLEA